MTERRVYYGSVGPFLYDDTDPINDPDGELSGESYHALATTGQLIVEGVPTSGKHVVRLGDLHTLASELRSLTIQKKLSSKFDDRNIIIMMRVFNHGAIL